MISDKIYNRELYYRLIALWVICEAFAGGVMHAANVPFTGMVVSSLAVTCIILIAYYIPTRSAVLKATIVVIFFKLMLSPHSPPTAYIAVLFQGYLGYILFNHRKHFYISSVVLATLALIESAVQRVLVLLVIYGNDFWNAVDIYIQKTIGGNFNSYSASLALVYIVLHMLTGLFVGTAVARLVIKSGNKNTILPYLFIGTDKESKVVIHNASRRKKYKPWLFFLWSVVLLFYFQAVFQPAQAVLPANKMLMILIRSFLIILTWYLIISPLLMFLIKHFIKDRAKKQYIPVREIQQLIPGIKQIFFRSWQLSGNKSGLTRLKHFIMVLLVNIIYTNTSMEEPT